MNLIRRWGLLALIAAVLVGCGTSPRVETQIHQALAPTGKLRVGVYLGSPTSMVKNSSGDKLGVTIDLGKALAEQLGVPFELVEFSRVAEVIDALKNGKVDFTFTNASAERAKVVDFTEPLVAVELGYLVSNTSPIRSMEDADKLGMLIGVSQGSSSQATLTRLYKNAKVAPVASIKNGADQLRAGQLDAFATNKAVLFEMSDNLPGFKILNGRWGLEYLAIAIPQGREAGAAYVKQFAMNAKTNGVLEKSMKRAGLRGTVSVEPQLTTGR